MTGRGPVLVRLHGSVGGAPVTVVFAGTAFGVEYVVPYLVEAVAAESQQRVDLAGDAVAGHLSRLLGHVGEADIAVVEGPGDQIWELPMSSAVVLPMHVGLVVDLPSSPDAVDGLFPRRESAWIRRQTATYALSYRVATSDDDLVDFYETMYLPTMRARHGGLARLATREEALHTIFRSGVLLQVRQDGSPVGGLLGRVDTASGTVHARLTGVLDGAPELVARGVLKVAGRSLLDWACRAGHTAVDLQGAEPFLRRGTLRAKVLMGARITHPPGLGGIRLWLSARRDTPAVRAFLVRNPMLACDRDDRIGTVRFLDAGESTPVVDPQRGVAFRDLREVADFLSGL